MNALTSLLIEFDHVYKGLSGDSIMSLIIDMKLIELILKEEQLIGFQEKFNKLSYLTGISESFIWDNFKECVKHSAEYDPTAQLADLNKEIQNRFLLRCMQEQIDDLT